MTPTFSVLILTAAPPGLAAEAGGAFVRIDGREALLRSVELFLNRENVKQVRLAVAADAVEEVKRKFGTHLGLMGVKLVSADDKWLGQIAAGAAGLDEGCSHVIVHDAARCVVPYSDIDALAEAAAGGAAAVGLVSQLRSVLVEVDESSKPVAYHLPDRFLQLLTPQAFSREAYLQMARDMQEVPPSQAKLVKGSPLNVRIAGPGDASLAKTLLHLLPKPKMKAADNPFEEAQW